MNKLITTLAAGAFASFSAQSKAEDFSEAVTRMQDVLSSPRVTWTLKNTYEGETYEVTSETWVFEDRCDNYDWLAAFGQIATVEMNDYRVGYSDLTMDVLISTPRGNVLYSDLSQDQLAGMFVNTNKYQGTVLENHAEDLLSESCKLIS